MSFLNVLSSIGGDQNTLVSPQPNLSSAKPKPKPKVNATTLATINASTTAQKPESGVRIPPAKISPPAPNGFKRKAEDVPERSVDSSRPPPKKPAPSPKSPDNADRIEKAAKSAPKARPKNTRETTTLAPEKRAPTPGSFAALMADAKAAQEQTPRFNLGMIKHQPSPKERLTTAEKRLRKENKVLGKQPQHNSKIHKPLPRIVTKRDEKRAESTYRGTAKPATPISNYKGTAGLPSRNRPTSSSGQVQKYRKVTKYNDYLGTDEEDLGEGSRSGETEEPASDLSSDMEAGALDLEREESDALRVARVDDAKEREMESELKQKKLERRRKLEALAKRSR